MLSDVSAPNYRKNSEQLNKDSAPDVFLYFTSWEKKPWASRGRKTLSPFEQMYTDLCKSSLRSHHSLLNLKFSNLKAGLA